MEDPILKATRDKGSCSWNQGKGKGKEHDVVHVRSLEKDKSQSDRVFAGAPQFLCFGLVRLIERWLIRRISVCIGPR